MTTRHAEVIDAKSPSLEDLAAAISPSPARSNDRIVRAGIATFLEVGKALALIHAGKQYRELGFSSFESYCQDAAGHGARWGYRLMVAAESATNWSQSDPPANEYQARVRGSARETQTARPLTLTAPWLFVPDPDLEAWITAAAKQRDLPAIQGEVVDASELRPQLRLPYWHSTETVKAYLGKVRDFEAATAEVLESMEQGKVDSGSDDLTLKAVADARAHLGKLQNALKARRERLQERPLTPSPRLEYHESEDQANHSIKKETA